MLTAQGENLKEIFANLAQFDENTIDFPALTLHVLGSSIICLPFARDTVRISA
jgi:hypothetical protein